MRLPFRPADDEWHAYLDWMNALANDQARRVAKLIHQHKELGGVTVGLYTGDSDGGVQMTETSVIGDKYAMRRSPPDILLTNYKMLDTLLRWLGMAARRHYRRGASVLV